MRIVLAFLAALSLLAGVNDAAIADDKQQAKSEHPTQKPAAARQYSSARAATPPPDPYIERDASKLPFGSAIWWDQMRREGRLGGETP